MYKRIADACPSMAGAFCTANKTAQLYADFEIDYIRSLQQRSEPTRIKYAKKRRWRRSRNRFQVPQDTAVSAGAYAANGGGLLEDQRVLTGKDQEKNNQGPARKRQRVLHGKDKVNKTTREKGAQAAPAPATTPASGGEGTEAAGGVDGAQATTLTPSRKRHREKDEAASAPANPPAASGGDGTQAAIGGVDGAQATTPTPARKRRRKKDQTACASGGDGTQAINEAEHGGGGGGTPARKPKQVQCKRCGYGHATKHCKLPAEVASAVGRDLLRQDAAAAGAYAVTKLALKSLFSGLP